ncbi:hypothetical protein KM043_007941 [Ampulex compressa]|nr:hypothetical protein KM043_007941 [Ampulex compressa]
MLFNSYNLGYFTGSCREACTVLSSGTASPYSRSPSTAGLVADNNSCTCQCNFGLPTFREDLHICVNDIHADAMVIADISFGSLG